MRGPGFESRSGHVLSSPVTHRGSVWVRARATSSKGTVLSVLAWFRADSRTNLIKQEEFVTGRHCGSVAEWSVLARYARGPWFDFRSGRAFFSSVTRSLS